MYTRTQICSKVSLVKANAFLANLAQWANVVPSQPGPVYMHCTERQTYGDGRSAGA